MRAFVASLIVLALVVLGARYGLQPWLAQPAAQTYAGDAVRLGE